MPICRGYAGLLHVPYILGFYGPLSLQASSRPCWSRSFLCFDFLASSFATCQNALYLKTHMIRSGPSNTLYFKVDWLGILIISYKIPSQQRLSWCLIELLRGVCIQQAGNLGAILKSCLPYPSQDSYLVGKLFIPYSMLSCESSVAVCF